VPDFKIDVPPGDPMNPFIMNPEGVARLFALDKMAEGPFPEHYEPFETPLDGNPLNPKVVSNPAARIFPSVKDTFGTAKDFPYAATTYRLTEHFHFWTKHTRIGATLQPEQFVEMGEELASKKGIKNGDRVRVWSKRGQIFAKAVVTKRIHTLKVGGKEVETVGIPIHWGFEGLTKPGYLANTLTPFVADANAHTPEFKAFLVNVEKA
jgi:anaerobic selenocysteine-containing dehydrogenase